MYEKSVTGFFYTLQHFHTPGVPSEQCTARPLYQLSSCHISSHSENPSMRYLLPKFVDFIDISVTHTKTNKQTVNNIRST